MANSLSVLDMIAAEALKVAHEKATFIGTCDMQFDDSFNATSGGGNKNGSTLRVRNPNQYTRRQGSRVMDVQDQDETTQTITVATQDGVDMRFNSQELTQSVDKLRERYIEPAVSVLVSGIDADCLETATKETYKLVGTAGTVVGAVTSGFSDTSALGQARAKLNQGLAPKDSNRFMQMDSITMASVANGIKGLFHPKAEVEKAWREGFIGQTALATFYENERTYVHANGADHTTMTVNDAGIASGDSTLTLAGATMSVGTIFTLEAVYDVHPETKVAYAHLKQFVVTAVSSNDYTFSPAIVSSGAKQNVDALPVTGCDVTAVGSASTSYRHNLMYHKNAFAFVTAELPLMDDAHKCVRLTKDGLSIRLWQASDIRNDELLIRMDILYGFKTLRPEWSCRITN